jgi:RNA polymerase sigma factor (sigma-70 family)
LARDRGGRSAVLRPLHNLLQAGVLGDRSDGELLREFMAHRKETAEPAFTALVGRHGAMVWRVCRSVLTDPHEAEDAFQATFLVLVQHARSVRRHDSLASWLYGVAYRVACCARSSQARRRDHEHRAVADREQEARQGDLERAELRAIVVDELNRLSNPQRQAVVLCDMEELTHEQAAAQLGWPVGTVKSRLARGRERLKSRLIRRGLAPSVGLIGAAVLSEPVLAAPSAVVVSRVVQLALAASAGLSVTGSVSGVITFLVREVSKAMWISKLRWVAFAVLTSTTLSVGGTFLWQRTQAQQTPPSRPEVSAPAQFKTDDNAIWARHFGNLKRIGLAMHNYQSAEEHFPAASIQAKDGKPLLSWRVALLPYLVDYDGRTREDLYKAFRLDEPWDSPHNKALLSRMPAVFASPGKATEQPFTTVYRGFVSAAGNDRQAAGMAGMMGAMGGGGMKGIDKRNQMQGMQRMRPGMGMMGGMMGGQMKKGRDLRAARKNRAETDAERPDDVAQRKAEIEAQYDAKAARPKPQAGEPAVAGPMGGGRPGAMAGMMASMMGGQMMGGQAHEAEPFGSRTFFRESQGVQLAEITDGTSNTIMVVESAEAVPWTKPDDLPFPDSGPLPRLGGSMRDGFAALFVDARVRLIDQGIPQRILRNLITPNGGEIVSADELPSPESPPPGGLKLVPDASAPDAAATDEAQGYAGAGTLQNAIGILKDRLKREGKSELAEWLIESRARRTIVAGLHAYETYLREIGDPPLPREQFEIAKPICRQIAEEGPWPPNCWLSTTSVVETRDGITYDHHQVRLVLEPLDRGKPFHFSLLVLDLFYGPVERTSSIRAR